MQQQPPRRAQRAGTARGRAALLLALAGLVLAGSAAQAAPEDPTAPTAPAALTAPETPAPPAVAPAPPAAATAAPAPAPPADPLQPLKDAILRTLNRARRGDPAEAAAPDAAPVERFLAALGAADDELAWPMFKQLALEAPREPWGDLGQARIYVLWKLVDQADAAFARALGAAPGHPVVLVERAIGHRAFGRAAAARADASAVLAVDPNDARALLVLAWLAEDAGAAPAEVKAAWQRALAASADLFEARVALAAIAESEGDASAAREGTEALAQMSPRDLRLQRKLAALRWSAGDAAGSAAAYEAAIALGDGSKETWAGLASARRAARDVEGEEKALGRLRRIDPKDRAVIVRLFNLRAQAKDVAGMDEQAKAMLALDPKDSGALLALAIHRGGKGDLLGQLEALQASARGNPHPEAMGAPDRAREELQALREKLGLPPKPLQASTYDGLYLVASRHLTRLYDARRAGKPGLRGKLGLKLRIGNAGGADAVEVTEDTLGEPALTMGLVAALKEGSWPKAQKTLNFKFDLAPPGSRPAPREPVQKTVAARPAKPPPPPTQRATSAEGLLSPR